MVPLQLLRTVSNLLTLILNCPNLSTTWSFERWPFCKASLISSPGISTGASSELSLIEKPSPQFR